MEIKYLFMCVAISGLITSLSAQILFENSECQNGNAPGICTKIPECPAAKNAQQQFRYHNFTRCGFLQFTEIVCCPTGLRMVSPSDPRFSNETRKAESACTDYVKNFPNSVFPQISAGQNATAGQFPYMAALGFYSSGRKNFRFKCGGTLISEKFVLTAGHCLLRNREEEDVRIVRLGVTDVPEYIQELDGSIDFKIKNFTIHPNYTTKYVFNDIGLIELESPIQLRSDLRPACLFTHGKNYPQEYVITGWGEMNEDGRKSSILQSAIVYFMPFQDCTTRYAKLNRPLISSQLCATHSRSDICEGDSGGPLLMRNSQIPIVVGISSFGLAGCAGGNPSVYTSISQYLDWIESIVWQ